MKVLSRIFLLVAATGTATSAFKYRPSSVATSAAVNGAMWETAGRTYEPKGAGIKDGNDDDYDDGLPFEILTIPAAMASSPRGGGPIDCTRSTVLTFHSLTAFGFSLLFLLGSVGIDLPFGPASILRDFDLAANVGDVLLCRLCAAYLFGIGMFEKDLADDERAQKAFTYQHIALSAVVLLTKGSFASDNMYYMIGAMLVGFTAAGLLAN